MRLLQSVLTRLKQTKAPQRKFVTHLFRTPTDAPWPRHLSQYESL